MSPILAIGIGTSCAWMVIALLAIGLCKAARSGDEACVTKALTHDDRQHLTRRQTCSGK